MAGKLREAGKWYKRGVEKRDEVRKETDVKLKASKLDLSMSFFFIDFNSKVV